MDRLKMLLSQDGVVAIGRDRRGIVVYVRRGFRPEGVPSGVRVKEIDSIKPYFCTLGRVRPVVSGVSVAHWRGTAGTLGGIAEYKGDIVGLGCNHVLALRWGTMQLGNVGDPILQPGPADGGMYPRDYIGDLEKWSIVRADEPARVDAAIFRVHAPVRFIIPEIGYVTGIREPEPGMVVKKFGRTSLLTFNKIEAVDVVAKVNQWGTVIFEDMFMVRQPFAYDGDSGSLILDELNRAVGMVVAGNSDYILASKASNIENELGISIIGVNKHAG